MHASVIGKYWACVLPSDTVLISLCIRWNCDILCTLYTLVPRYQNYEKQTKEAISQKSKSNYFRLFVWMWKTMDTCDLFYSVVSIIHYRIVLFCRSLCLSYRLTKVNHSQLKWPEFGIIYNDFVLLWLGTINCANYAVCTDRTIESSGSLLMVHSRVH